MKRHGETCRKVAILYFMDMVWSRGPRVTAKHLVLQYVCQLLTVRFMPTQGDIDVISPYPTGCFSAMMWTKVCEMFVIVTSLS